MKHSLVAFLCVMTFQQFGYAQDGPFLEDHDLDEYDQENDAQDDYKGDDRYVNISGLWQHLGTEYVCEVVQYPLESEVTAEIVEVSGNADTVYGFEPGHLCFAGSMDGPRFTGVGETHYPRSVEDACPDEWRSTVEMYLVLSDDGNRLHGKYRQFEIYPDCKTEFLGMAETVFEFISPLPGSKVVERNTAPIANDDQAATVENGALVTIPVLANDFDHDEDDYLIVHSSDATSALGAAVKVSRSNVIYDPNSVASLERLGPYDRITDSFSYTIADANGNTASAMVAVRVAGKNDPPHAVDDKIETDCQWRSKKGPPWRCKKGPLGGCGLVPVVHGRAPRATRRALNRPTRRRAREGPVGPWGQAWVGWSVQFAVGV